MNLPEEFFQLIRGNIPKESVQLQNFILGKLTRPTAKAVTTIE